MIENPTNAQLKEAYKSIEYEFDNLYSELKISDIIDKYVTLYEDTKAPSIIKFISWCDRFKGHNDNIALCCTLHVLYMCWVLESRKLPNAVLRLIRMFYFDVHSIPFGYIEQALDKINKQSENLEMSQF